MSTVDWCRRHMRALILAPLHQQEEVNEQEDKQQEVIQQGVKQMELEKTQQDQEIVEKDPKVEEAKERLGQYAVNDLGTSLRR
jgi:hypothetical protein